MKTLKVEAVYPMAFETFEDVTEHLSQFIDEVYNNQRATFGAGISQPAAVRGSRYPADRSKRRPIDGYPQGRTPLPGQFSAEINNRITIDQDETTWLQVKFAAISTLPPVGKQKRYSPQVLASTPSKRIRRPVASRSTGSW